MQLSDEAEKYRKKSRGLIVQASVTGGYFGGLAGLITWMALAKKSPRPTLSTVLIYAGDVSGPQRLSGGIGHGVSAL